MKSILVEGNGEEMAKICNSRKIFIKVYKVNGYLYKEGH